MTLCESRVSPTRALFCLPESMGNLESGKATVSFQNHGPCESAATIGSFSLHCRVALSLSCSDGRFAYVADGGGHHAELMRIFSFSKRGLLNH
jgi:hypothetical protein